MLCEKCFRCSKCKVNRAVAQGVVDEDENPKQNLYQGPICEACYRELVKCKVCKVKSAVKPEGGIRKNEQKINVCESCFSRKEPTQQKPSKAGNYILKLARVNAPDSDGMRQCMADAIKKFKASSKSTLTCCKCQTEFTDGYMMVVGLFYCKKHENSHEFKAWVEEVKKQEPKQEPPKPKQPVSKQQTTSQPDATCSRCGAQNLDCYGTISG
jgi:hypothetical protein